MSSPEGFICDRSSRSLRQRWPALAILFASLVELHCSRPRTTLASDQQPQQRGTPSSSQAPGASSGSVPAGSAAEPPIQRVLPYPRGRWRLAASEDLDKVVLWFSHVLIRYDSVLDDGVSFSLPNWSSVNPRPPRSREEALTLARRVAAQAVSGKVPFAELVAAHSDDITTVIRGGALGGVTASSLEPWPQIVDALAVLKPGQTSEVVETPFGFHILKKQPPPPEELVSGSRIVIGHDDAPMLRWFHGRGRVPHRTRAEAEALARRIYERARTTPAEFPALVERYTEHRDAEAQGDLGEWSTRDLRSPAREIDALAALRVGEVSAPIDTFLGFQILMRTAQRERAEFAHEALELFYDATAPAESADSEAAVRARTLELAVRLSGEPQAFDALRKEFCCLDAHLWREGRQEKSLQTALSQLNIGELGITPVRTAGSYSLLRRLDPKSVPRPPSAKVELPATATPDVDAFLGWRLEQSVAEAVVRRQGRLAVDELGLEGDRRARLLELHAIRSGLGTGDERVRAVAALANGTRALLNDAEQEKYDALAVRVVERAVLEGRASLPHLP